MVNVFTILKAVVKVAMKLAGMSPHKVEIEPGTVINFWVPTRLLKDQMQRPAGRKRKPSVVFLHGFFLNGIFTWIFQVLALAFQYDVYVPDLLFFGESATDKPHRSTAFQAECVARGLQKLGVERCSVVGFSYGGVVAFKLGKMYSSLVESVVVTGSTVEFTQSRTKKLLEGVGFSSWSEFLLPKTMEELKRLLSIGSETKLFTSFPSFVYRDFLQVMYPWRKERADLLHELVVPDYKATPSAYTQRIYLLWGEMDKIFSLREANETLLELGEERASLLLIKNAGHLALVDSPFCYNSYLKQILASHCSPDSR